MSSLTIEQIPVLRDNYVYLLHDETSGATAAVDPSEAPPVARALADRGWRLTHILNTHHHWDHTGGNIELKAGTGCTVVGFGADAHRIPAIDVCVDDGETFTFGPADARIIAIPGHTLGHIAYWFADEGALFCGDTLFSLGCGRLFEGTPGMMWRSLGRLRTLPDEARVYCGHEYTEANAAFALTIDPENAALRARAQEVRDLRRRGLSTVPSRLGDEKAANPFLRADAPEFARLTADSDPVAVFAEIRRRKDVF